MIASPDSSRSTSSLTVLSVISPAGTITHAARGLVELGDEVVERVGAGRALAGERRDRVGVDVEDDALVAVAHQPPDEVRAHPSESDHPKLHGPDTKRDRGRSPIGLVCAAMPTEADILVIFGITGDLAQKMTFEALYRLEGRGELNCRRILGIARNKWDRRTSSTARRGRRSRRRSRTPTRRR